MRRSASALLAVALLTVAAAAITLASAPVARASCTESTPAELRDGADASAVGTITTIDRPSSLFSSSSSDPVLYGIAVSGVYSGTVQETILVSAPQGYALDGAAIGQRYVLFLSGVSPEFTTDACSSLLLPITDPESAAEVAAWAWSEPELGGAEVAGSGNGRWIVLGLGAAVAAGLALLARDRWRRRVSR